VRAPVDHSLCAKASRLSGVSSRDFMVPLCPITSRVEGYWNTSGSRAAGKKGPASAFSDGLNSFGSIAEFAVYVGWGWSFFFVVLLTVYRGIALTAFPISATALVPERLLSSRDGICWGEGMGRSLGSIHFA
jgi:hypothetical protein